MDEDKKKIVREVSSRVAEKGFYAVRDQLDHEMNSLQANNKMVDVSIFCSSVSIATVDLFVNMLNMITINLAQLKGAKIDPVRVVTPVIQDILKAFIDKSQRKRFIKQVNIK